MKQIYKFLIFSVLGLAIGSPCAQAQITLRGKVLDDATGEALIGTTVIVFEGGTGGSITNYNGEYAVKVDTLPAKLRFSYTGYATQELEVKTADARPAVGKS